jgi:hypothetical protein
MARAKGSAFSALRSIQELRRADLFQSSAIITNARHLSAPSRFPLMDERSALGGGGYRLRTGARTELGESGHKSSPDSSGRLRTKAGFRLDTNRLGFLNGFVLFLNGLFSFRHNRALFGFGYVARTTSMSFARQILFCFSMAWCQGMRLAS